VAALCALSCLLSDAAHPPMGSHRPVKSAHGDALHLMRRQDDSESGSTPAAALVRMEDAAPAERATVAIEGDRTVSGFLTTGLDDATQFSRQSNEVVGTYYESKSFVMYKDHNNNQWKIVQGKKDQVLNAGPYDANAKTDCDVPATATCGGWEEYLDDGTGTLAFTATATASVDQAKCYEYDNWRKEYAGVHTDLGLGGKVYGAGEADWAACKKACEDEADCLQVVFEKTNKNCYGMKHALHHDQDGLGGTNNDYISAHCHMAFS